MKRKPKAKPRRNPTKRDYIPCPSCRHRKSEVVKVLAVGDCGRRLRLCLGCGCRYLTTEATAKLDTGIDLHTGIKLIAESLIASPQLHMPIR